MTWSNVNASLARSLCSATKGATGPDERLSRASVICGTMARDTDPREQLIDLVMESSKRLGGRDPRPHRVRLPAPLEHPHPGNPRRDRRRMECPERSGDILGAMMVDLADKSEREMELIVALPARARNPVHRGRKLGADRTRWPQRDKEAVRGHGTKNIGRPCPRATISPLSGFA